MAVKDNKNMSDFTLTPEEIKEVEETSVYSSDFDELMKRIETKYNLVWDNDSKQYKVKETQIKLAL